MSSRPVPGSLSVTTLPFSVLVLPSLAVQGTYQGSVLVVPATGVPHCCEGALALSPSQIWNGDRKRWQQSDRGYTNTWSMIASADSVSSSQGSSLFGLVMQKLHWALPLW